MNMNDPRIARRLNRKRKNRDGYKIKILNSNCRNTKSHQRNNKETQVHKF